MRVRNMLKICEKKGTIGITMVMMVFCLLMAVSTAYHKTIQTETIIKNNTDYSDRALDAAFSGVNYAMAQIQSYKKTFSTTSPGHVYFATSSVGNTAIDLNCNSSWISLSTSATFDYYYDEDRKNEENPDDSKEKLPPYRFKVACMPESYFDGADGKKHILIKSYGDYFKYEVDTIIGTYSAQIMAECIVESNTRTIRLKRYRKMQPQIIFSDDGTENINNFYSFVNGDYFKDNN